MRYDTTFSYRKPAAEWKGNPNDPCNFIQTERPNKVGEWKKFHEESIAEYTRLLNDGVSPLPDDKRKEYLDKIREHERALTKLPRSRGKVRHTYKKIPQDQITAYARKEIALYRVKGVEHIIAEDIAHQLDVQVHFVKLVFQKLNIEGILAQPVGKPPHDTNREENTGGFGGWSADWYRILPEK